MGASKARLPANEWVEMEHVEPSKSYGDALSTKNGSMTARPLDRDELKLAHFGKRQQFRRNFSLVSVVSLSCTLMITWEAAIVLLQPLLINGGPTGAFAAYIYVIFGVSMQVLVMGELGSMIPLSGGAYNWVAILAPPQWSNVASYIVGWVSVIAWQAACVGEFFIGASLLQAVVTFNYPQYEPTAWQTLLIAYALIFLGVMITTIGGRIFPHFESLTLVLHVLGFFCIFITLLVLAPKNDPSLVFHTFVNGGGFSSDATSWLVGTVTVMFSFIGIDAATHMAEEIANSQIVIPWAMIISAFLNGSMGIGILVAMLFSMGGIDDVLESEFSIPCLGIFERVTGSKHGATAITAIILSVAISGAIGVMATASRMLWAFAREGGVPGSRTISKVNKRLSAPVWAIGATALTSMLLLLITLGSETAFNAFANLTVCGFYSAFIVAASIMLYRRMTNPQSNFMWGPFRLGKLGVPITIVSLIYSLVGWIFSFFPPVAKVDASSFNWSFVVYWAILLVAFMWWFVSARHHYTGPRIEFSIWS